MGFFAEKIADGYGGFIYQPTIAGFVTLALLLILLLVGIVFINKNKVRKKINVKQMVFAALAVALAVVTSNLKIIKMPMGGSVTLFSMLFICLIGYWYGVRVGVMTGVAYGLVQLIIDPYIVSIPQLIIDYFMAFGALGLSGIFSKNKSGLIPGYLTGVIGRYVFSILSGIVFFASYAPETMSPLLYSFAYNGAYLGTEAAITVGLLCIPPVSKAIKHTQGLARE